MCIVSHQSNTLVKNFTHLPWHGYTHLLCGEGALYPYFSRLLDATGAGAYWLDPRTGLRTPVDLGGFPVVGSFFPPTDEDRILVVQGIQSL